jgi:predicted ATPase
VSDEISNYIVVIHGRGVLKTCLTKGTHEQVIQRAEACLLSGFEVHLYSLKLETCNRPSYLPEGVTPLQQEFNLWDATDEFKDLTNSITMHCDEHTANMSKKYLQQCVDQLQEEIRLLEPEVPTEPTGPAFPSAESTSTGS